MDRFYRTKEIASRLKLDTRTIKRWCQLMEEAGLNFFQDSIGRKFSESDMETFVLFNKYVKRGKMKAQDAAILIANSQNVEKTQKEPKNEITDDKLKNKAKIERIEKQISDLYQSNQKLSNELFELKFIVEHYLKNVAKDDEDDEQ